ncbi:MAG: hypothetical protein HZA46_24490 [Planctomycetales bacterium]|nr:hypothetical protein [Planctomycetales bacterium]
MRSVRTIALALFAAISFAVGVRADDEPVATQPVANPGSQVDLDLKPLSAISTRIATPDDEVGQPHLPPNLAESQLALAGQRKHWLGAARGWSPNDYCWTAPGLMHRPLYFEEINLERYGYSHGGLQPALSAVTFAGNVALLPYQMTLDRPSCPIYALGYDRPGNCVPYSSHRLPWRANAALVEGLTLTGLAFAIPW